MEKYEYFNTEINYINDYKIKESAKLLINGLPEYFFSIPASSTGKYHPSFTLGNGGLVRHTKVAVRIAKELLDIEMFKDKIGDKRDLLILSLLLHDGIKKGMPEGNYTALDHPNLIAKYIYDNKDKIGTYLTDGDITFLMRCVKSHMGEWNKNMDGKEILDKPVDKYQKFVHMCDYLASRKFLDVKFNGNEIE